MDGLCRAVAAHASRDRSAEALVVLIWTRLQRVRNRLLRIIAEFQAGTLPPPRMRHVAVRSQERPDDSRPARARPAAPRGFAWLVRMNQETASYGLQLQHLLTDTDMVALVQAAPQVGRMLRPIFWMTAVRPAPAAVRLPTPPRPPRTARPRVRSADRRQILGDARPDRSLDPGWTKTRRLRPPWS